MSTKNITIKRATVGSNGTASWDTLYPKTHKDQVVGLSDELTAIRNVAAGRNKSYPTELTTRSGVEGLVFANDVTGISVGNNLNSSAGTVVALDDGAIEASYNYLITVIDGVVNNILWIGDQDNIPSGAATLNVGDNIYITDLEYPDLWFAQPRITDLSEPALFYTLETEHPDLSGFVQSSSLEDVAFSGAYSDLSGTPTFHNFKVTMKVGDNNAVDVVEFSPTGEAKTLQIKAGSNISLAQSDGVLTISSSDQYTGTVTGSNLTTGKIIIGGNNSAISAADFYLKNSSYTWATAASGSGSSAVEPDKYIPSMLAISNFVLGKHYINDVVSNIGLSSTYDSSAEKYKIGYAANYSSVRCTTGSGTNVTPTTNANVVTGQIVFEFAGSSF